MLEAEPYYTKNSFLDVNNLSLHRSNRRILNDINFTLNSGITSIIGPNGAGKTSFIKCLSGIINDFKGSVKFMDQDLMSYNSKSLAKIRAFASQSNEVNFPFSVSEIVEMGRFARGEGLTHFQNRKIAQEVIKSFDIEHLSDQNFNTLSGGEKQRVQLARVFTQIWELDSALLFLDEPISALDFNHQVKLFDLLKYKKDTMNWRIIIILHDLQAAAKFSDYSVLMHKGGIYKYGKTSNILNEENLHYIYQTEIKKVTHGDKSLYSIF